MIHKGMQEKTTIPHPVTYQSPKTQEPTSHQPSLPALAHKAAIPTEGVSSQIKNNIYTYTNHQIEMKTSTIISIHQQLH